MSTLTKLLLPLTLVLATGFAARADEGQRQELSAAELAAARATMTAFAKRLEGAEFLAADYVQTRETFLFGKPIVSKGHLRLRREPACLRMDVREPKVALIRSDATSHLTWHEGKPRAERLVFPRNETAVSLVRLLTGDVERLEQVFRIRSYSSAEGITEIGLVPLDEELREQLTSLSLELETETSLPRAVEHENADGEKVRIALTKPVVSEELEGAAEVFDDPLPEGITIVTRKIEKPD